MCVLIRVTRAYIINPLGAAWCSGQQILEWSQARTWSGPPSGPSCATNMMSNDSRIQPPLSEAELNIQCGNNTRPCKLQWNAGADCYNLSNVPFSRGIPGFVSRAEALDYRTAAGPSGTTQNMLQYALYLGMDQDWLPLLRLAMLAWMLPTRDHSLFEILLGADPYMPVNSVNQSLPFGPGFRMVQGLHDLSVLCPRDLHVSGSIARNWSRTAQYKCRDLWKAVANSVETCDACTASWDDTQFAYWQNLIDPHGETHQNDGKNHPGWKRLLSLLSCVA